MGCSVPKEADFPEVRGEVEKRSGAQISWNRGGERDDDVRRAVRRMTAHPLAPAEAVQIALLNNPRLQATYEDLSIAQADVVQAGLLKNPVFTGQYHFPISGGADVNHFDFGVEQDFLDTLLIPARRKVAKAAFGAAKLRVGSAVLDLAFEVRAAYFTMQGAERVAAMRSAVLEAAGASFAVSEKQHEATNISDLDLANEQALFEATRLDVSRSQLEVVVARERLNKLMGLWGADTSWRLADKMAELPTSDPPLERLENLAIAQRLDVAAGVREIQARSAALDMVKDWRWLPGATVGAGIDRESDGPLSAGPQASLELPIFDQKQATLAKLEAEVRRSQRALAALAIDVRSEVRERRARLVHQRDLAEHYKTTVIPLHERIVALSQQQYDAMLLGVHQLLQAKQSEVNAYREYIEAVRDYWIAHADLNRACGGRISDSDPALAGASTGGR